MQVALLGSTIALVSSSLGGAVWVWRAMPKHPLIAWCLILSLGLGGMASLLSLDESLVTLSLCLGIGSFILLQAAGILLLGARRRRGAHLKDSGPGQKRIVRGV